MKATFNILSMTLGLAVLISCSGGKPTQIRPKPSTINQLTVLSCSAFPNSATVQTQVNAQDVVTGSSGVVFSVTTNIAARVMGVDTLAGALPAGSLLSALPTASANSHQIEIKAGLLGVQKFRFYVQADSFSVATCETTVTYERAQSASQMVSSFLVFPLVAQVGDQLTLSLTVSGGGTTALVNGQPVPLNAQGNYTANFLATQTGRTRFVAAAQAGAAEREAIFFVYPTCILEQLDLVPPRLGNPASLRLSVVGNNTGAGFFAPGFAVPAPLGPINGSALVSVLASTPGTNPVNALVTGPDGTQANCFAQVTTRPPLAPTPPPVIPTYVDIPVNAGCIHVSGSGEGKDCTAAFSLTDYIPAAALQGKTVRFKFRWWGFSGLGSDYPEGYRSSSAPAQACGTSTNEGMFGEIASYLKVTGGVSSRVDITGSNNTRYLSPPNISQLGSKWYALGLEYNAANGHRVTVKNSADGWGSCSDDTCVACISSIFVTVE